MILRLEMTDDERRIDQAIRSQLENLTSHLRDVIVLETSVAGDSFFAEVILNDGSRVSEAEEAMLSLKSSLSTEGIKLEPRVAAEWSLKSVEYGGICRGESGGIRSAEYFSAELVAGTARQTVTVEVSQAAFEELKERLGAKKPEGFQQTNALVCEILRDEINLWLSRRGESRWNPVSTNLVQLSYLPTQKYIA